MPCNMLAVQVARITTNPTVMTALFDDNPFERFVP